MDRANISVAFARAAERPEFARGKLAARACTRARFGLIPGVAIRRPFRDYGTPRYGRRIRKSHQLTGISANRGVESHRQFGLTLIPGYALRALHPPADYAITSCHLRCEWINQLNDN